MLKTLKNKIFAGMFILAFVALGSLSMKVEATTSNDGVMNPPALGVVIKGCEVPGAAYSPITGESCSTKGVAITPPIVFFPPYTADGCGPVGPYSISTGNKCSGLVPMPPVYNNGCPPGQVTSTVTGVKCADITPMPPIKSDDCLYNKNCVPPVYTDGCKDSTGVSTTGKPCAVIGPLPPVRNCDFSKNKECGNIDSTHPVFSGVGKMIRKGSSTDDVRAIQAALNKALKANLKETLSEDGRWGAKTTDAVKMFQKWAKLKVDGRVGPMTLEKMKSSVE